MQWYTLDRIEGCVLVILDAKFLLDGVTLLGSSLLFGLDRN